MVLFYDAQLSEKYSQNLPNECISGGQFSYFAMKTMQGCPTRSCGSSISGKRIGEVFSLG